MEALDISHNKFTTLPSGICEITSLNHISGSYNQISRLLDCLINLSSLKVLSLNNKNIKEIPASITSIKFLRILSLRYNPLTPSNRHIFLTLKKQGVGISYGTWDKNQEKLLEN